MARFAVVRTTPFDSLAAEAAHEHPKLHEDTDRIIGRLATSPETMGNRVPDFVFALPIYKTRYKDSCHALGASAGWRIYYGFNNEAEKVFMLFLHHKNDYELCLNSAH